MTIQPSSASRRHVLYLHGFRSSPHSAKALQLRAAMRELGREADFWCEALPASPRNAVALVRQAVRQRRECHEGVTLVGSSLGGFYATVLSEELQLPAVLLNPGIEPARDLASQVGVLSSYHDAAQRFEFLPDYLDELRALRPVRITPQNYFLVAATGDEVLSYREMLARYAGCRLRLIEGSDHGLSDFEQYLPEVLAFCGVS